MSSGRIRIERIKNSLSMSNSLSKTGEIEEVSTGESIDRRARTNGFETLEVPVPLLGIDIQPGHGHGQTLGAGLEAVDESEEVDGLSCWEPIQGRHRGWFPRLLAARDPTFSAHGSSALTAL